MVKICKHTHTYIYIFIFTHCSSSSIFPTNFVITSYGWTRWPAGSGVKLKTMDKSNAQWLNRIKHGPLTLYFLQLIWSHTHLELENASCLLMNIPRHCRSLFWYHHHLLAPNPEGKPYHRPKAIESLTVVSTTLWIEKQPLEQCHQMLSLRASLVVQWLRICLPMQGTRVRALVWEDPTCCVATRPVSHNYWACASGACALQQERPR